MSLGSVSTDQISSNYSSVFFLVGVLSTSCLFPGFSYFVMPYLKDVFLKCVCFIIWKYNWFFGILILYSAVLLDSYQFSCRCADLPRTVVAPWEMALLSVPCCHSGFYWMRSFWSFSEFCFSMPAGSSGAVWIMCGRRGRLSWYRIKGGFHHFSDKFEIDFLTLLLLLFARNLSSWMDEFY